MKRHVSFVYALNFIALVVILTGCGSDSSNTSATNAATSPTDTAQKTDNVSTSVTLTQAQYKAAGIQLGKPESRTLSTTLKVNGVLDVPAQSQISVSVPYGGYIRQIKLEPGMRVSKGQTLVVLENPEFIGLQQDYLDTKARLEYADLDYTRQQELSRENVNALKTVQKTRSDRQSLQAQLAGLSQRLSLIGINPTALQADHLTRTMVVPSPVSGYVTSVPTNNGRFVNPADVIVELTDVRDLHVHLSIFEKDITQVHEGQLVQFGLQNGVATFHTATIFLKGKSIATDRTIPVLARPAQWSDDLIPGAYVTAQIAVTTQPLSVLPEAAIVSFSGKPYVYVLESRSGQPATYHFQQIEIKTGVTQNGYVAVTLPPTIDPNRTPIVLTGAYSLLSQQNNSSDDE